ncbi:MAG TPA: ABC transporter permease [Ktedonobacterales bacterium]|jgi:ABC-type transport system involved in multi-copper enzyme maturation permease subunit
MAVKELIEARWKAIIGMVACVIFAAGLAGTYDLIKQLLTNSAALQQIPQALQGQIQQLLGAYNEYVWGQWYAKNGSQALAVLAAVLGCGLIGAEVNKGTIFFLLSKPVGRVRVLLVKYAVSAALLLAMIVASSAALLITAAIVGHPQPVGGAAISSLLLWLGTLFVLGLALLFSVVYKDILRPLLFALIITIVTSIPGLFPGWSDWSLTGYWSSQTAYLGQEFPIKGLIICLVAAALPVIAAIPLFRKQAY